MKAGRVFLFLLLLGLCLIPVFTKPVSAAQIDAVISKTWGGAGNDVSIGAVVDPSDDHVYMTGGTYSFGPGTPAHEALSLLKYDKTGGLVWQKIWSGSGNGSD